MTERLLMACLNNYIKTSQHEQLLNISIINLQTRKSKTVETNLKNLNVNKFDLEFEVSTCTIGDNTVSECEEATPLIVYLTLISLFSW